MDKAKAIYVALCVALGGVGAWIGRAFGGWDHAHTTLCVFLALDYLSGLAVAGIFKRSDKSETGALESNASWKGLAKKIYTLLLVLVAHRIDLTLGVTFIKNAAVIAFIANEAISLMENAGLMGIPIPSPIAKAIDVLKAKGDAE